MPIHVLGFSGSLRKGSYNTALLRTAGELMPESMSVFTNMFPLNRPEILVMRAQEKFDAQGRLTDETMRGFVKDQLAALEEWTNHFKR